VTDPRELQYPADDEEATGKLAMKAHVFRHGKIVGLDVNGYKYINAQLLRLALIVGLKGAYMEPGHTPVEFLPEGQAFPIVRMGKILVGVECFRTQSGIVMEVNGSNRYLPENPTSAIALVIQGDQAAIVFDKGDERQIVPLSLLPPS